MLSNSGKTQEVIDAGSHVEEAAHFLLAITMDGYSDIAQMADRCMLYPIPQDSGPFGRLPTESSECQQRWIDAIANHFAVQNKHNLKFGHPGGQIGKHYDTTD
jgi:D-arabinose 5-phosphate isomerase GutQ